MIISLLGARAGASIDGLVNSGRVIRYTMSEESVVQKTDSITLLIVILISFLYFLVRLRNQKARRINNQIIFISRKGQDQFSGGNLYEKKGGTS